MRRYALRDDQFARIEHLLPGRPGHVGRNSEKGNRLFVEAVIWKFRTGAPWRDMPERFGDWKNIHKRFDLTKPQGVRGRNSDNTRLRQVLKWEPQVTLEEGLESTYRWIYNQLVKAGRIQSPQTIATMHA